MTLAGLSRPRDEQFVLAVDLGTGGPKVGLVSVTGSVAWQDLVPVATRRLPGGGAVQDAEEWWHIIGDAVGRALASGVITPDQVVAVSCTGQWASTVPVDADGVPVGECLLWQDTRGGDHVKAAIGGRMAGYQPKLLAKWVRRTAGAPSPSGGDLVGHMLHLQHDEPEVAARARWYLEPVDYLSMRFSGVAAASHASMTAAWLTDNRRLDRCVYDDELIRLCGLDGHKLPPLVPTGSVVGPIAAAAADRFGLSPAVRVVTGTPDLHSAACGAGAVDDFQTHLAISTSAWIGLPVPWKRSDVRREIVSVPGLGGDGYLVANNHETGGLCLQWLRDRLSGESAGREPRVSSYESLCSVAATAPPGSGGLIFTPWLNGERSPVPDRLARGGFHNLSLTTSHADLIRAVLEGVAYNNRWLHQAVEHFAKRRLDPIRLVGGGAQSDLWCQIHADVMDRTIERVVEPLHANLRGAALFAGLALGAINRGEIRQLVGVDATFRPDPSNRAIYDRLYAEFPKLYHAQKRIFARLNRTRS